jgi:hypothetical protein
VRSGDSTFDRSDPAILGAFSGIKDTRFVQLEFRPKAALLRKTLVNGLRNWTEYKGQPYDEAEFTMVEGYWDHEHCSVCWFKIEDGHSYWSNHRGVKLLCDECHQAFSVQQR